MKLTMGVLDLSDDTLRFAKQYGVTHLKIGLRDYLDADGRGVVRREELFAARDRVESFGLHLGVALLPQEPGSQHWNIRLGRPEREREIDDVCRSIETVGDAGIPTVEYVFNLAAVWGSSRTATGRGAATVRHFDYAEVRDRDAVPEFSATSEEVWERIEWFLTRAVPVAEASGVSLACHPDDPPVPTLRGETRVLGSFDGLKRLIEIVPSRANGLNFCQGTVAEMGEDVLEVIRYFGSRGRIHHVHFRNIRGALPRFDESFIDDGDIDMWAALEALKDVGFEGTIMPDHVPDGTGDSYFVGRAYALGYMRAMMHSLGVLEP